MNYHDKYLKYKNKYLKLKKQLGGSKYEELIPIFTIDIEFGATTTYKLIVNNKMTVEDVYNEIIKLIQNDPTKNKGFLNLEINLLTNLRGKYVAMEEDRLLSDYGFKEGSKIIITPKLRTGL